MLRVLLVLLVLANAVYFGWRRGALEGLGFGAPLGDREPARLGAQLDPEAVVVLTPAAASAALRAARTADLRCVEAGPFTDAAADSAEAALRDAAIPATAWVREKATAYAVFAGRYAEAAARRTREAELRRARIAFEPVEAPAEFAPGFLVSRHPSRDAAQEALAALQSRAPGLGGLRVVAWPGDATSASVWLRAADAGAPLRAQLQAVATTSGSLGTAGFRACEAR